MKYGWSLVFGMEGVFIPIEKIMFTRKTISSVFTLLTIALLGLWWLYPDSIQWEPIVGILLISKEVVINRLIKRIERLEFSPAISLAHGYVNNFLEPVIGELLSKSGFDSLNFKIYIPNDLEELSDQQIERIKHQIQSKGFRLKEIKLKRKTGRPHDVLTVEKQEGSVSYFDFPRTLLSLQSYIDYKTESARNESTDLKKQSLGKNLVEAFRSEVQKLIKKKNLEKTVTFVGQSLDM